MTIKFEINGQSIEFDGASDMPLLWYLRENAGLTGTKFGCGIAACGACTVHVDGKAQRSCVTPLAALEGRSVQTIEALADKRELHAVQQAWLEHDVPQCGYCQAGQIMSAADLLNKIPSPTAEQIDSAMTGNICRCGTYVRIRKAIADAAEQMEDGHE